MLKSPCCPNSAVENLAFTMYAVMDELENELYELIAAALDRPLTEDEINRYMWLCKETGIEINEDIISGEY